MVSGYNRGGVTIHAPLGDGNDIDAATKKAEKGYNPRPVRGRKSAVLQLVLATL